MSEKILNSRIVHKHDTAENWSKATNFIPMKAEIIVYDIDENYTYPRIKIGDGKTLVSALPFVNDALINAKLSEAKSYTDAEISEWVGDKTVAEQISTAIEAIPAPNWNANEGEEGFIENRTHWEGLEEVDILPETTVTAEQEGAIFSPLNYPLITGSTVKLVENGVEYESEVVELELEGIVYKSFGNPYFGNPNAFEDNGLQFLFVEVPEIFIEEMDGVCSLFISNALQENGTSTISIRGQGNVVHKIPQKFISDYPQPEWGKGKDISTLIANAWLYPEEMEGDDSASGWITTQPFITERLVAGKQYKVLWNGLQYICTGIEEYSDDGYPLVILGNHDLMMGTGDTGEPFIITEVPEEYHDFGMYEMVMPLDGTTEVQLAIFSLTPAYHQIPYQYIGTKYEQPHWGKGWGEFVEIFPETEVTEETAENITTPLTNPLILGGKVILTYNGTDYECVVEEAPIGEDENGNSLIMKYFGNPVILYGDETLDNGVPFVFVEAPAELAQQYGAYAMFVPLDYFESGPATISIRAQTETIHKIPSEYLEGGSKYKQPEWGMESGQTEIFSAVTLDFSSASQIEALIPLKNYPAPGDEVTVVWDGVNYTTTVIDPAIIEAEDGYSAILGNLGSIVPTVAATGEPFIILLFKETAPKVGIFFNLENNNVVSASAFIGNSTYHKIPHEFIGTKYSQPDWGKEGTEGEFELRFDRDFGGDGYDGYYITSPFDLDLNTTYQIKLDDIVVYEGKPIAEEDNRKFLGYVLGSNSDTTAPFGIGQRAEPIEGNSGAMIYGGFFVNSNYDWSKYEDLDLDLSDLVITNTITTHPIPTEFLGDTPIANWNENDPSSPAHVVGRTHWEVKEDVVVYDRVENSVHQGTEYAFKEPFLIEPVFGRKYKIIYNDEIYEAEYLNQAYAGFTGQFVIENMRRHIYCDPTGNAIAGHYIVIEDYTTPSSITLSIIEPAGVHQLDEKFIPSTIARVSDLEGLGGGAVESVNGKTGAVVLSASDVGAEPSGAVNSAISTWVGDKTVSSQISTAINGLATETYVNNAVAGIVESAPETLNTLNELAAALGDDPNFATTVSTELGRKVPNTRTINGKALSSDITLSASDVGIESISPDRINAICGATIQLAEEVTY